MLQVRLNLDSKPYARKDDAKREVGSIRNRVKPTAIDIETLPSLVEQGYSFCQAELNGTLSTDFVSEQLFCVDVDNDHGSVITPSDAVEKMEAFGITPLFMYYSFSHTEEHPKFRVVVLSSEPITDSEKAMQMREGLYSIFPPDDSCSLDANRIYFGTNKGLVDGYEFTGATVNPSVLLDLYFSRCSANPLPFEEHYDGDSKLARAIEEFDLVDYIEKSTGIIPTVVSGQYRFDPCPICGHRDHFDVVDNVFNEKSPNGGWASGNIINYLQAKNNMTLVEAREYFMYSILGWDKATDRNNFKETKRMERAERYAEFVGSEVLPEGGVPEYVFEKYNSSGELVSRKVNPAILAQHIREREHYIFVRNNAVAGVTRFWYTEGYYKRVSDDEIKGIIKGYIERYDLSMLKMHDVNEVFQQLTTDRVFHNLSELNSDEKLVNFKNGVLDMETMTLMPHDPKYLITRQIPVTYNPDDDASPVFDTYMKRLCNNSPLEEDWTQDGKERYMLLMEYLGVAISNIKGYRFKKVLFMYGAGSTGKSQLRNLAEYLIGADNCASCDLRQLEARFGTSVIFDKRLAGSGDMPYMTLNGLDILKQVTGGDTIFAENKGKDGFHFVYDGLLWFCMNQLPFFGGDNGPWVYDRFIPFECTNVVPQEKRDRCLLDKMKAEAPAIAKKALSIMYENAVIKNDYAFDVPAGMELGREQYKLDNDNVLRWVSERCIVVDKEHDEEEQAIIDDWIDRSSKQPTISEMHSIYRTELQNSGNGEYIKKLRDFKATVLANYPGLKRTNRGMTFTGICMKPAMTINVKGSAITL